MLGYILRRIRSGRGMRKWGHSSVGRALPLQGRGRRFEPGWLHSETRSPARTFGLAGLRGDRFGRRSVTLVVSQKRQSIGDCVAICLDPERDILGPVGGPIVHMPISLLDHGLRLVA
jgi:hypothetical protein